MAFEIMVLEAVLEAILEAAHQKFHVVPYLNLSAENIGSWGSKNSSQKTGKDSWEDGSMWTSFGAYAINGSSCSLYTIGWGHGEWGLE